MYIIDEEVGRLWGVDPIAVITEDTVQGGKDRMARHPKTQKYPCLQGGLVSLDPEDRNIAKPTWAQEVQGELPDSFIK